MQGTGKKWTLRIVAAAGIVALGVGGFALAGLLKGGRPGPPQKDMIVDDTARREVIENLLAALNQHYIDPDKAAAFDKHLRARLQHGDFDGVTSAERFADMLTDAVQDDTHDKHIEVHYFENVVPELPPGQDQSAEDAAQELRDARFFNFGFETVGRLRGDIGYIDLHQFGRPAQAAPRIAAAMTLLADTKALIIDLRKNHGGDPETVMLFASYLFDKRTHLNDIYWRDENRTEERWTTDEVPGTRYGQARRIYVLTSDETFSAGEDLAYALKYAGRATVVGETTGGGAHPGNPRRLSAHFMTFVPNGRTINPVTHGDWEGVGVTPDVVTKAKNAQDVAHLAVLKELVAVETDPDAKRRMQATIDSL